MKKSFLIILLTIFVAVGLLVAPQANAATFNKNRLIDDSLFIDHSSMSVAQIQNFLEEEGGGLLANWVDDVDMRRPSDNCVVHKATGMTAAEIIYEASTAWNAQIVENCNGSDVSYWGDPDYSNYTMPTVSPKVLLVTLQKEQSLISASGTYPSNPDAYKNPSCCSSNAYKLARATGYGVPDSGSINEQYLGFYNQINWAAWQLRYNFERAAGNTGWDEVGYKIFTGPFIEGTWKRCDSCAPEEFDGFYNIDGSPLYMENRATASLYYYTPHTYPGFNGNYNFVQFYSDWFGSVFADYKAKYHNQSPHPTIVQGEEAIVYMRYKNNGSATWYDDQGKNYPEAPFGTKPVRLAASKPLGRKSDFGKSWGPGRSRATGDFNKVWESDGTTLAADQNIAEPGQIVEFAVKLTVPVNYPTGTYREFLHPIVEGAVDMNQLHSNIKIRVVKANYQAKYVGQSSYPKILQGERTSGYFMYKNVGNVDWYDNAGKNSSISPVGTKPVRLATKPLGRSSKFGGPWPGNKAVRVSSNFSEVYESDGTTLAANQNKAEPGQIVKYNFELKAPKNIKPGKYREKFIPILEGTSKMNVLNTFLDVTVQKARYVAEFKDQSAYPSISKGDSTSAFFIYQNDGNVPWYDNQGRNHPSAPDGQKPVRLATNRPLGRSSDFGATWGPHRARPTGVFGSVYESDGTTLAANQHIVEPGQIARFDFIISVPNGYPNGVYKEFFTPVLEGSPDAFKPLATHLKITVTN